MLSWKQLRTKRSLLLQLWSTLTLLLLPLRLLSPLKPLLLLPNRLQPMQKLIWRMLSLVVTLVSSLLLSKLQPRLKPLLLLRVWLPRKRL